MIFFKRLKIKFLIRKLKSFQQNRLANQPSDAIIAKEIELYMKLRSIYKAFKSKKRNPYPEIRIDACLKAAASLDYPAAQYELGNKLLEEAKFREQLEREIIFSSPSNQTQIKLLYAEAHAYLLAAEARNHILAKRLRGLCYINGWGVEVDKNRGFELVVASIEQENSWEKVPQIFASIGLNKPEFFSALGKHRDKLP